MGKDMTGLNEKISNLIDSGLPVVSLKSDHNDIIVKALTDVSRNTGKAIYVWSENDGLSRIDAAHIAIPRTQDVGHLLNHLSTNKHYGIYVLQNLKSHLNSSLLWQQFAECIAATAENNSMLVLLGEEIQLPESLRSLIAQIWRVRTESGQTGPGDVVKKAV